MEISTAQLPSGGYGYNFPSVTINPMNFMEICNYLENIPKDDDLGKYLYDIKLLVDQDPNIMNCYVMDLDFLIFFKKLITVSGELTYNISIKCPNCGKDIKKVISFDKHVKFKQIDPQVMKGAYIELNSNKYEVRIPTVKDFMDVFDVYLRYRKITDIKMIKTIALINDFEMFGNRIEKDVIEATHSDITLLLALRDLYYDRLEPVELTCSSCNKEEGGNVTVSIETLTVDFFRDLCLHSPIDGSKILFK